VIILPGESKTMPKLTKQIMQAAIAGFEGQKRHIDAQIAELRAILNGGPATLVTEPKPAMAKRKVSSATLRRMKEGQQRRWAKTRSESATPLQVVPASKPKRRLSAAGKAAIVAALKKRWAEKARAVKSMPVAKKVGKKKAA
jgi:hypothetical protein